MLNRVTNLTMSANAQRTLQTQQSRLSELQEKATTLNKISRPSDDPAATAKALETRVPARRQRPVRPEHRRRQHAGSPRRTPPSSRPPTSCTAIKDLTVLAGNGSLNQSGKNAIALELEALNKDLVSIANSKHLGRNIFAGSSDAAAAFSPAPRDPASRRPRHSAVFNGAGGSPVERRISATQTVRVDADGAAIFGSGTGSVFDAVSKIADELRSGDGHHSRTRRRRDSFKNIVDGRAEIGTRQAQLERAGNVNTELEATLDAQRTGIEKADLGSVIMDLKLQETNYQVALAATARVLQPTLMDFLR